ncbi:MAG: hypothetical protein Q4F75_01510 [Pseudomonadota bacterium]|jgi:putative bacteriophage protein|nr:hypothetical protein [Pseudomonadota bacterium]DAS71308.1 MAG TPA: Protein of unknown function (DUF1441) [Caudoviricetes sp.]
MAGKLGISIRAYAKRRGITHGAVQKAIESHRITPLPDGSIDPITADKEWEENTDYSKVRTKSKASDYAAAQILKLKAEATLAQIKVKKEIGAVIPTDEVIVFMRVLTTDLANQFLSLGRMVAPRIIGEQDITKITRIIDENIKNLIKDYKDDISSRIQKATTAILDNEDT